MAVLMSAELPGGTKEMIDGMISQLEGPLRSAQGFTLHTNGPAAGGWRVTEVWDSQADFEAWFEARVKPLFPEGAPMPSITFSDLNEVITA
jgi:hypothetical protein